MQRRAPDVWRAVRAPIITAYFLPPLPARFFMRAARFARPGTWRAHPRAPPFYGLHTYLSVTPPTAACIFSTGMQRLTYLRLFTGAYAGVAVTTYARSLLVTHLPALLHIL